MVPFVGRQLAPASRWSRQCLNWSLAPPLKCSTGGVVLVRRLKRKGRPAGVRRIRMDAEAEVPTQVSCSL